MANEQHAMSPSMHVPSRLLRTGYGSSHNSPDRQLAVYTPPPPPPLRFHGSSSALTASRFKLPEGWEVEEVPRSDASRVDKYYYEPMTGHKFRSLREVERYVNGEVYKPRRRRSRNLKSGYHGSSGKSQKSSYRKMIVSGGQMLRLDEDDPNQYNMAIVPASSTAFNSPYKLPEGWIVEEVPRSRGGHLDKYYYEPGTGRKFRSLLSVDKYLAEVSENTSLSETLAELREYNLPLSKVFKIGGHVKNPNPWKPTIPRDKVQSSTFNTPPMKINWVIASPEGNSWNPFIGGSLVPEAVKQQWSKRFMLSINNGRYEAPNF